MHIKVIRGVVPSVLAIFFSGQDVVMSSTSLYIELDRHS